MTIILDDASEPGSWARAMARGCLPSASDYEPSRPCGSDIVEEEAVVRHEASYPSDGVATS